MVRFSMSEKFTPVESLIYQKKKFFKLKRHLKIKIMTAIRLSWLTNFIKTVNCLKIRCLIKY